MNTKPLSEHLSLLEMRPALLPGTLFNPEHLTIVSDLGDFELNSEDPIPSQDISNFLQWMDGQKTVEELTNSVIPPHQSLYFLKLISELDRCGLIDDAHKPDSISCIECLFELEDLLNQLLGQVVYQNPFWQKMGELGKDYPPSVLYGFAIENYHFLFREANFDSPVLSYQSSTQARLLMNAFYAEEYGHDNLILKSLETIGLTKSSLQNRRPLPSTMMMCNALAYWASTDPIFFFATLGVLEGNGFREEDQVDSYLDACQTVGLPTEFIKHIKAHAMINLKANHGNLTREIFQTLGHIDRTKVIQLKQKMHLFIEMYHAFYQEVWEHYQHTYQTDRYV